MFWMTLLQASRRVSNHVLKQICRIVHYSLQVSLAPNRYMVSGDWYSVLTMWYISYLCQHTVPRWSLHSKHGRKSLQIFGLEPSVISILHDSTHAGVSWEYSFGGFETGRPKRVNRREAEADRARQPQWHHLGHIQGSQRYKKLACNVFAHTITQLVFQAQVLVLAHDSWQARRCMHCDKVLMWQQRNVMVLSNLRKRLDQNEFGL